MSQAPLHMITGQSFRDSDGQRWWIKGPRPGGGDQFVVEVEMKGPYPRVGVYAMTQPEFRERAKQVKLTPEHAGSAARKQRAH